MVLLNRKARQRMCNMRRMQPTTDTLGNNCTNGMIRKPFEIACKTLTSIVMSVESYG